MWTLHDAHILLECFYNTRQTYLSLCHVVDTVYLIITERTNKTFTQGTERRLRQTYGT